MTYKDLSFSLSSVFSGLNILSSSSHAEKVVVDTFRLEHRTLQQNFMRVVIIPILQHLAESYEQGRCDGRNMASGRLAKRMLENLTDDDLHLPFI